MHVSWGHLSWQVRTCWQASLLAAHLPACVCGRVSRRQNPPAAEAEAFDASVRTLIGSQVVFYMAPAVMVPSLYLQLQQATIHRHIPAHEPTEGYNHAHSHQLGSRQTKK